MVDPSKLTDAQVQREARAILEMIHSKLPAARGQLTPGVAAAIDIILKDEAAVLSMFEGLIRQGKKAGGAYLTIQDDAEVPVRTATASVDVLKLVRETFGAFVEDFCHSQAGVAA